MKLKEWAKCVEVALEDILEEHGEKEVVYASDAEGNSFQRVHYGPGVISVNVEYEDKKTLVVCIN